jgi:hypothetical protein
MGAEQLLDLWRIAPAAALLVLILFGGYRGWWYWDVGVRRLVQQIERDRDIWRALACALLQEKGVTLPPTFVELTPEGLKGERRDGERREGDRWRAGTT